MTIEIESIFPCCGCEFPPQEEPRLDVHAELRVEDGPLEEPDDRVERDR
jgi:hypothetical protein